MSKVTARFYVRQVTRFGAFVTGNAPGFSSPAPLVSVELSPVNGSKSDANKSWASATPSGEIKLTVGNPAAAAWFDSMLGKDVAITFEERPEGELE